MANYKNRSVWVRPPASKVFRGKLYYLAQIHETKSEAENHAKRFRASKGAAGARVVKTPNMRAWAVYGRLKS